MSKEITAKIASQPFLFGNRNTSKLKYLNGVQCTGDIAVVRVAHKLNVAAYMQSHIEVFDWDVVPGVVTGLAAA